MDDDNFPELSAEPCKNKKQSLVVSSACDQGLSMLSLRQKSQRFLYYLIRIVQLMKQLSTVNNKRIKLV